MQLALYVYVYEYAHARVFLCGYVSGKEKDRRGAGGSGIEHGAVIIYRSRYHRLLVNRPHQGDGVKWDGV